MLIFFFSGLNFYLLSSYAVTCSICCWFLLPQSFFSVCPASPLARACAAHTTSPSLPRQIRLLSLAIAASIVTSVITRTSHDLLKLPSRASKAVGDPSRYTQALAPALRGWDASQLFFSHTETSFLSTGSSLEYVHDLVFGTFFAS